MSLWEARGPQDDVVLSSRVRIARNVSGTPFPTAMDDAQGIDVAKRVALAMKESPEGGRYRYVELRSIDAREGCEMVERHLVSPAILRNVECGTVLVRDDEHISVMINEEDHLRIQCILNGLQLEDAYTAAADLTQGLEEKLPMAFHEHLGYLCACPTNVGTGVRASVMMHLAGLSITGQLKAVIDSSTKSGVAVRGIYGEGSEAMGELYQISNQTTLGLTEEEIIGAINGVCMQLLRRERETRRLLMEQRPLEMEDMMMRSWAMLSAARKMSVKEFMKRISDLRLAIGYGYVKGMDYADVNRLMIAGQPAAIMGRESIAKEGDGVDMARAALTRETMSKFV